MTYKDTPLWRAAFVENRADATQEEQARLVTCYEAMRSRASALVSKISADLPHMTIHDVTHLDALWEMASLASGSQVALNPAEAFVFGGAVLLHDAAMTLAAFPGGIAELKQTVEWKDLYARHSAAPVDGNSAATAENERQALEGALRLLHAKHAENLPMISWAGPHGDPMYLIEDQQVRQFYGSKIGKIAYSHWWSIGRVDDELSGTLGALPGVTACTVDLLKVACMLRVADAMHLDQRRAPAFEFALRQPSGISADHWKFQERMAKPFVQGDALVYTAQPPFEVDIAEAWWTAFDALQMVDRELRNVDRVLRDRQKPPLLVRRVEGVQSPEDLARTVETVGWTPVDSTVRVSDVPKIVATLGGSKLYGQSVVAPIRELIQNSLDAINARRRLQSRPAKWGELSISLEKRDDAYWLLVEDNGVGMSTTVLTGPLIDFGNSFWRSSLAVQEFPGLASMGMKPRGKYGIGFFSVFMLGDHVRVVTRRYDQESNSARALEFRNGMESRPNLRDISPSEAPVDGGTRVEIKLKINPAELGGLLHKQDFQMGYIRNLDQVIASIAPASDVNIKVYQEGKVTEPVMSGDWLDVDATTLLGRIAPTRKGYPVRKAKVPLAELRDEDGRIYGRASIDAEYWNSAGILTVDGLSAGQAELVSGVLVGTETTASRNAAKPTVPPAVLASWATEQAIAFAGADLSDSEKADAAVVVLACGGDLGELPIIHWKEEWLSTSDLASKIEDLEELVLYLGDIDHDEDDGVTKRDFERYFELNPDIAQTASTSTGRRATWISAIVAGSGRLPVEVLKAVLTSAWGEFTQRSEGVAIGEANGAEIFREVIVFARAELEDEEA